MANNKNFRKFIMEFNDKEYMIKGLERRCDCNLVIADFRVKGTSIWHPVKNFNILRELRKAYNKKIKAAYY